MEGDPASWPCGRQRGPRRGVAVVPRRRRRDCLAALLSGRVESDFIVVDAGETTFRRDA